MKNLRRMSMNNQQWPTTIPERLTVYFSIITVDNDHGLLWAVGDRDRTFVEGFWSREPGANSIQ